MREIFDFKGKKVPYTSEWIQGTLWVHVNGKTFTVESQNKARKNRKGAGGDSKNHVQAPMPGKVTKVLAKVGDVVKKGQAVVVMEAMKMEYTLKAEVDGKVKTASAQVGSQVSLGDILVEFDQEKT